ncbi:hypothetical protein [Citrobacter sp. ESBL3]|uniref:hypothetical protein n=1 Tax=Citrobacter sp. ESBL3 TaxID=3077326 RepID=UPI002FC7E05D
MFLTPHTKMSTNVFFQNASMIPSAATGLMIQHPIPISAIPMSQYDVSVRDLVMTGKIRIILAQLDDISKNSNPIITSGNHGTLKIHINTPNNNINKVSLYPVVQTAISNANFLVLKAVGGGLSAPVSQLIKLAGLDTVNLYSLTGNKLQGTLQVTHLKEFLSKITVGDLINKSTDFLFKKAMSEMSQHTLYLRPSIMQADKKPFFKFIKVLKAHIKPLVLPSAVEQGADVSICHYPYVSPKRWEKEHHAFIGALKNKVNSVIKNDYLIKIGSHFNRNHAGLVIDLETHHIAIDELMFFLSVFDSKNKLVNCFLDSGLHDL